MTAREPAEYNSYDTNYRFTGKLFDTDTGLYYYGARYYDPELGRFIQPDTIVPYPDDPQSFNRYAYARNNPIRYIDPTGHSWSSFINGVIGGVVAGVILALTGGAGACFMLASIAAGIAGGATTGALTGGWQGALIGGGIGAITGAGVGQWGAPFAIGAALLGGGYAYATGGWGGLGDFGSGMAGGIIGGAIGYNLGNAMVNAYSSGSPVSGSTNDPPTAAEIQQVERATGNLQGTTDAIAAESGTLQARVIAPKVILENATGQPDNAMAQVGNILGGLGLELTDTARPMKVPYNGKITFIPKSIVARAGNALRVVTKGVNTILGVADVSAKFGTFVGNIESGGGFLQAVHDGALVITSGAGFLGKPGTPLQPLRLIPLLADSVDATSAYWANRIYGIK